MKTEIQARMVVIYVNSTDQWQGRPLYVAIVQLCEESGMAGATVVRCAEGYGASHYLHTTHLFELCENLPMRIEIIDVPERIEPLLVSLEPMIGAGQVMVKDVLMQRYFTNPQS
jgi:uncharacterized protein